MFSFDDSKNEFIFSNHTTYFSIAYHNCNLASDLASKRKDISSSLGLGKKLTEEDYQTGCREKALGDASIIAVIFSALTLEAFINHYAIINFSKSYLEKHLDKLNTPSKFLIIPKLIKGKELDVSHTYFKSLNELFTLRNQLVHYKSKKIKLLDFMEHKEPYINEKYAQKAIQTVLEVLNKLKEIDEAIDLKWIDEAKYLFRS